MQLEDIDKELEHGARVIAKFYGNGDEVSLDDAVYEFLEWFDLAQHVRKLGWRTIARRLMAAGAGRQNGQPFTESHLSGVVWRQRARAKKDGRRGKSLDELWLLSSVPSLPSPSRPPETRRPTRAGAPKSRKAPVDRSASAGHKTEDRSGRSNEDTRPARSSRQRSEPRAEALDQAHSAPKLSSSDAKNIRAIMDRARRLRNPKD